MVRATTTLLLLAALASGCTDGKADDERRTGSRSDTDASASPVAGMQLLRKIHAPRVAARVGVEESEYLMASPRYLLTQDGDAAVVTDRRSGREVQRIVPSGDWQQDGFELDDEWLTWATLLEAPDGTHTKLMALRLPDGKPVNVGGLPGVLDPGLPDAYSGSDSQVVYTTQDGHKTNCIAVADLDRQRSHVVQCTASKAYGTGHASITRHGVVFNQWRPRPKPAGCVSLWTAPHGGEPAPVHAKDRCTLKTGVLGKDFVAWTEQWPGTPEFGNLYAQPSGGMRVSLGRADMSTERICGDHLYWVALAAAPKSDDPFTAPYQVRRWAPGTRVEVVLETVPERDLLFYDLTCNEDRPYVVRSPFRSGRDSLLELTLPP
jgi:hypothetical protein